MFNTVCRVNIDIIFDIIRNDKGMTEEASVFPMLWGVNIFKDLAKYSII